MSNDDQSTTSTPDDTNPADEVLQGAEEIRVFLKTLGFKSITVDSVYYAHKKKKWPITKFGKDLFSTKTQLKRHAKKILSAATTTTA
jgi:hypothetical protein